MKWKRLQNKFRIVSDFGSAIPSMQSIPFDSFDYSNRSGKLCSAKYFFRATHPRRSFLLLPDIQLQITACVREWNLIRNENHRLQFRSTDGLILGVSIFDSVFVSPGRTWIDDSKSLESIPRAYQKIRTHNFLIWIFYDRDREKPLRFLINRPTVAETLLRSYHIINFRISAQRYSRLYQNAISWKF